MLTPRSPACAEARSFVDIPDCPKKHFDLCYLLSGTVTFDPLMFPGNHMSEHVCTVLRQRDPFAMQCAGIHYDVNDTHRSFMQYN